MERSQQISIKLVGTRGTVSDYTGVKEYRWLAGSVHEPSRIELRMIDGIQITILPGLLAVIVSEFPVIPK